MEELAGELLRAIDDACDELRGMNDEAASVKPAPDVWSIKEILGHLADSAANNHQRFVRAQQSPLSLPGYDQDHWVASQGYQERSWQDLLTFWAAYNRHLAHVIRRIPDAALDVPCRIGPSAPVSLRFLAEDYLVHLRHHLGDIRARSVRIAT